MLNVVTTSLLDPETPFAITHVIRELAARACQCVSFVFRYGRFISLAARCQAAWAGQWVEAAFSNAPTATRRTCFTSLSTRSRSLTLTRTARPRPRTRNRIAASRLTVAPPRRQGDNPDQVEHLTSRRPRPQPVSFRRD